MLQPVPKARSVLLSLQGMLLVTSVVLDGGEGRRAGLVFVMCVSVSPSVPSGLERFAKL